MASRRKRPTEHDITEYDVLLNAIKNIIINKRSKKSTAAEYKISRISLLRYVAKFIAEVSDILTVSDDENCADICYSVYICPNCDSDMD